MQNYHNHKSFSNINTSFKDSAMLYDNYAKRAVELGQDVLSSVEHGWQGNYLRCYQAAQKYSLKFVYGTEAYWVRDRHEDDRTNAHIIILAKTLEGIYQINEMLSDANETGYYFVPRVDPELMSHLDPNDVFITTACVAFWGKVDKDRVGVRWHYGGDENDPSEILRLFDELAGRFHDSMALEVQCHNTSWQKEINRLCIKLKKQYKIPLIVGLDSHYIYDYQKEERRWLREESGVRKFDEDYEFDEEVYEDYPDEQTVIDRLRAQGILNEDEIREAIDMTDTICLFDDIEFDTSRKLPTIYPDLTQEERNQKYLDLVWGAWERDKEKYLSSGFPENEYIEAIEKETNIVTSTSMSDYFILDHELVELGKKKGGYITPTGRGSASSFFTNTLLGLSTIDRISLPVPLYPERFVTADRLKTSSPDIDLNLSDQAPFAEAQRELMEAAGGQAYPMIAYGTLKYKSAFKLYARAQRVPADIANEVSKQIDEYERALKEAEDDEERELINITDYVSDEYVGFIEDSEPYRGIVVSKSQAPCAFMVYNGNIRREVGIMRINADQGKKVVYCTVIDGYTAEDYGYVKNDLLVVNVVDINAECMRRANLPQYTSREIMQMIRDDKATWDILAKGYTQGINQCQGTGTTDKLMIYKPRSVQDMAAFVAAIRPGFKSMVNKFLHREKFSYDIPSFDAILHNDTSGSSWMLYQENTMQCLSLAGFPMEETYPIIKAISKKKVQVIDAAKDRFLSGFSEHIMKTEKDTQEHADEVSKRVWQVIIDSASYQFNSAHAACVGLDALYGAYLKAHYPYEYYATLLDHYSGKGNKDKVALIKTEMKRAFGISVVPARFRQDNRTFFIDKEHHHMSDALSSIKYISKTIASELYKMRDEQFDTFVDLLVELDANRAFNSRSVAILIRMGYFEEFGSTGKLLAIYNEFLNGSNKWDKQRVEKTKIARLAALKEYEANQPESEVSVDEQLDFECEYLGSPISVFPSEKKRYIVLDANTTYSPKLKVYSISTGRTGTVKIYKKDFKKLPVEKGDIITVISHDKKPAYTFSGGERRIRPGVEDVWLTKYKIDSRKGVVIT